MRLTLPRSCWPPRFALSARASGGCAPGPRPQARSARGEVSLSPRAGGRVSHRMEPGCGKRCVILKAAACARSHRAPGPSAAARGRPAELFGGRDDCVSPLLQDSRRVTGAVQRCRPWPRGLRRGSAVYRAERLGAETRLAGGGVAAEGIRKFWGRKRSIQRPAGGHFSWVAEVVAQAAAAAGGAVRTDS